MTIVNSAVRIIVLAFVLIGGTITFAGPGAKSEKNAATTDTQTKQKSELAVSKKKAEQTNVQAST